MASTVNTALLYFTLQRRGHFTADARLKRRAWRLLLAALAMGGVLWMTQGVLTPYLHGTWLVRFLALGLLVSAGSLVYGALTFILGAFTREDIKFLRRKRAS